MNFLQTSYELLTNLIQNYMGFLWSSTNFLWASYDHSLYTVLILPLVNLSISDRSALDLIQEHILDSSAGVLDVSIQTIGYIF